MPTLIIAHGDGDGVTSAAIVKSAYGGEVFFSHPAGLLRDLEEAWRGHDPVFILDIALDELTRSELLHALGSLSKKCRVVYIDHHPLPPWLDPASAPMEVIHGEGCTAELAHRYLRDRLSREMERVAVYGAISDYEFKTPYIQSLIARWDVRSLFMEAGLLSNALEYAGRNYEFKREVVDLLASGRPPSSNILIVAYAVREAEEEAEMLKRLQDVVNKHGLVSYVVEPGGSLGKAARYAAVIGGTPVGVALDRRGERYVGSIRSLDPRLDLNLALRSIALRLGVHGGGHKLAAGARLEAGKLEEFIRELDKEIRKQLEAAPVDRA